MQNMSNSKVIKSLYIDINLLDKIYPKIDSGSEGTVYRFNREKAIKLFNIDKIPYRLNKIKELSNLSDLNFCFPTGLVYTNNNNIVGMEMDLVNNLYGYGSLVNVILNYVPNGSIELDVIKDIMFKINDAIKRVHAFDYTIGDLRPKNILIDDNNEPIFIDTDSGAYKEYDYDFYYSMLDCAGSIYNHKFSYKDIDRYVWAVLFLETFLMYNCFNKKLYSFLALEMFQNKSSFKYLIKHLNVSKHMKELLTIIFSDADDKPYIGDIFKDYNFEEQLLSTYSSNVYALKYMKKKDE